MTRGPTSTRRANLDDCPPSESSAHDINIDINNGEKKGTRDENDPYLSCWGDNERVGLHPCLEGLLWRLHDPPLAAPIVGLGVEATAGGGLNTSVGAFSVLVDATAIHSHSTAKSGTGGPESTSVKGCPMGGGRVALKGAGPMSSLRKATTMATTISYVCTSLEMG